VTMLKLCGRHSVRAPIMSRVDDAIRRTLARRVSTPSDVDRMFEEKIRRRPNPKHESPFLFGPKESA